MRRGGGGELLLLELLFKRPQERGRWGGGRVRDWGGRRDKSSFQ